MECCLHSTTLKAKNRNMDEHTIKKVSVATLSRVRIPQDANVSVQAFVPNLDMDLVFKYLLEKPRLYFF